MGDPQALTATRDNAIRNGVADKLLVVAPGQFEPAAADVVLANILAGPLINLTSVLSAALAPGGELVLSGILEEQAMEVTSAYRAEIPEMDIEVDDGWVRLHGFKPSPAIPSSDSGSGQA